MTGAHNQANAAAAIQLIAALGLAALAGKSITETAAICQPHLASFTGLPHRLQWIGAAHGISFVNDSKATNGAAAATALASYPAIYWIVGGEMKEESLDAIAPHRANIRRAYVIGTDTEKTIAALPKGVDYTRAHTLDKAVASAFADARADGITEAVVLLAPAAASFDQFANFEARGECFRQLAQALITPATPSKEARHVHV